MPPELALVVFCFVLFFVVVVVLGFLFCFVLLAVISHGPEFALV